MGTLRVDERGLGRPYFYAEVAGFEVLSPFSEKQTQAYLHELQRQREMLTYFIPEADRRRSDGAQAIVLDDQPTPASASSLLIGRSQVAMPESIVRMSVNAMRGTPPDELVRIPGAGRPGISWACAVAPDNLVFYTNIFGFDYARQSRTSGVESASRGLSHVFPLAAVYQQRRPRWPAWVETGLDLFGARFYAEQTLQVFTLIKLSVPPIDLSIEHAFAADRPDDPADVRQLRAQAACMLATWALAGSRGVDSGEGEARRQAFWRLAARTCYEPLTESLFVEHFGENAWSELRRAWTLTAASQSRAKGPASWAIYWPERQPMFPAVPVRRATRAELVRIKSEYEWCIGREFARAAPELAAQCLDQAGRRLRMAYADGERDARFLALLALYEVDVNLSADARRLVDEAVAAKTLRPRVYYHQARFREADERAKLESGNKLSAEQVRWVVEPLDHARVLRPALGEVYQLMTELWSSCEVAPPSDALAVLVDGAGLFPRDAVLGFNVALLHANAKEPKTAAEVAGRALRFAPAGSEVHARLRQLLALLATARS